MHVRGQIRAYVAARLADIDGLRDHVTTEARDVPDEAELPWALVSIGNETAQPLTLTMPRKLLREAELTIDLIGQSRIDAIGKLEAIAALIEASIATDERFGGLVKDAMLVAYTTDRLSDDASQPIVRLRMQYQLSYITAVGVPTEAL